MTSPTTIATSARSSTPRTINRCRRSNAAAAITRRVAIADHAVQYLREHEQKHSQSPFFLYLAFVAPHFPLHALPEDIARYRDTYRQGWDAVRQARWERQKQLGIATNPLPPMERDVGPPYHFPDDLEKLGPGEVNRPLPWTELTGQQREFQAAKMAVHAAMIDRMDREIGRVVEQLKKMGALDDTLILFASDNGASAEIMVRGDGHDPQAAPGSADTFLCLGPGWSSSSNTPLRRHKTWVHEGGIATPLIAHWPNGIAARGELRHSPAHLIDIVPTVLELTGLEHPRTIAVKPAPPLPGKSLVPEFAMDRSVSRDYLWWLHEGNRAIRIGDWKLVAAGGPQGPWELYDLSQDRGEIKNLAADASRQSPRTSTGLGTAPGRIPRTGPPRLAAQRRERGQEGCRKEGQSQDRDLRGCAGTASGEGLRAISTFAGTQATTRTTLGLVMGLVEHAANPDNVVAWDQVKTEALARFER